MACTSFLSKGFQEVAEWPHPNFEPIICRVETYFRDECVEITLLAFKSNHTVALIGLKSGRRLVARVDFAFVALSKLRAVTVPWKLNSEVATMRYVRAYTAIPVPKIYLHDEDVKGEVGGPWMVMDYVPHPRLAEAWPKMTSDQKRRVCLSVADIWCQLLSLRFDSIGSLCTEPDGTISMGPITPLASNRRGDVKSPPRDQCGPYHNLHDWMLAMARRKFDYVNNVFPVTSAERECVARNTKTIENMVLREQSSFDARMKPIVLEPVDLHPYNILVSRDDPGKIVSVLDWEGARTSPIWNVKPTFFAGIFDGHDETMKETNAFEKFIWEEVARRTPLWSEAFSCGKTWRNLATIARYSDWEAQDCDLE